MADKRKAEYTILLKKQSKTALKIDVFDADLWREGRKGLFRARLNGRWHTDPGQRVSFKTPLGIGRYFSKQLVRTLKGEDLESRVPDIPEGTSVRAFNGTVLDGQRQYDVTRTAMAPFRGYDGRWFVPVIMLGKGLVMLPVEDVEVRHG
jgi:hypothetical protein